jgi:hypothetical protein
LFGDCHTYEAPLGESRSPVELRADKFAQTLLVPGEGVTDWLTDRDVPAEQPCTTEDALNAAS